MGPRVSGLDLPLRTCWKCQEFTTDAHIAFISAQRQELQVKMGLCRLKELEEIFLLFKKVLSVWAMLRIRVYI